MKYYARTIVTNLFKIILFLNNSNVRKIKKTIIWLEDKIKAYRGKRQLGISEKKQGPRNYCPKFQPLHYFLAMCSLGKALY